MSLADDEKRGEEKALVFGRRAKSEDLGLKARARGSLERGTGGRGARAYLDLV